ncbi:MAG: VWA domain-containing protein [Oligoflexus sp.]|nr:VWA domain-containing protein [Oligoflexus sp.]
MHKYGAKFIQFITLTAILAACNETSFQADAPQRASITKKNSVDSEPQVVPSPEAAPTPAPVAEVVPGPVTDTELPPPVTVKLPAPVGPIASTPPVTARVDIVEESFTQQGMNGAADIAIVIDDSGSMAEEQNNLSTKLNDLVVALKDANWQIGVVTTSSEVLNGSDRCKLTLIKSSDTDADKKFLKAVTPGVGGSGNEEGIRQAVNALKCAETPWVRPNSTVAVLIVSDEDNCSDNGLDCPGSPANTEKYLIDYVEKDLHRVVGKTAGFYGIFAPPTEVCPTAKAKGNQYQKLVTYKAVAEVNYGNICDVSYKSTLERISNNIAKLLSSQFTLKQTPDDGSVVLQGVKSNGDMIVVSDYTVVGNVITFKTGSEPALGSDVTLSYKVTTLVTH